MEMDIDALLSSIHRGGNYAPDDDYSNHHRSQEEDRREQQSRCADMRALTRAWINERSAPELLAYPHDLVERVMTRIGSQITLIETETGNVDPKANFRLILLQTELERFKFLVRSFLRARIAKIDKFPLHLLSLPASSTQNPSSTSPTPTTTTTATTTATSTTHAHALLSPSELRYLTQHQTMLHRHYLHAFLGDFPEQLRRLDDTAGGISMVDRPDVDTAVLVRVVASDLDLRGEGMPGYGYVFDGDDDDGDGEGGGEGDERGEFGAGAGAGGSGGHDRGLGGFSGGTDSLDQARSSVGSLGGKGSRWRLRAGGLYVVRYSAVREALRRGAVELV